MNAILDSANPAGADSRVYLVEDAAPVRDALTQFLMLQGFRVSAFESAEDFLDVLDENCNGCAVFDIRLPGKDGLALQAELVSRDCRLPIIVISGHGDAKNSRTAFKAGAVDFLEKPLDADQFLIAVTAAMNADASRMKAAGERQQLETRLARLTAREAEVLEQLLLGQHAREIAEVLGISPRTVEVFKARLMEKLQVRRTSEVLRLMIAHRANEAANTPKI